MLLGAGLAVAWLIVKPVEEQRPAEAVAGEVYYVEGSRAGGPGRAWMRKRQLLLERSPGSISLVEEELNAWMQAVLGASGAEASAGPNFHLYAGRLQIGLPLHWQLLGWRRTLILQARGSFTPSAKGFAYVPDEVYLGSLPAHKLPWVERRVLRRLAHAVQRELPDELANAWRELTEVSIEGRTLRLTLP